MRDEIEVEARKPDPPEVNRYRHAMVNLIKFNLDSFQTVRTDILNPDERATFIWADIIRARHGFQPGPAKFEQLPPS